MKQVIQTSYGAPEVLQIVESEIPTPGPKEVLIKNKAIVITQADMAFRKGDPFISRFFSGLFKPKYSPGVELSGEVVAIGDQVTKYQVGDQVFGTGVTSFGTYTEYKCVSEDALIVKKPENISHDQAVGICDGATTSLIFLRDYGKIKPGDKVLINGASGSVGGYGVQLAKHFGAEVTAVCSASNEELVRRLGADHVIDYAKEDFTQASQTYDIIFDAVGKLSFGKCKSVLSERGIYLTTVPTFAIVKDMVFTGKSKGKRAKFVATGLQQTHGNIQVLSDLFERGQLRSEIDRVYDLDQIVEAHRYVEGGHKTGNVIVRLNR